MIVFAAVRLVTTRNLVHGALYLLGVLAGAAILFLLFLAEFVAWVLVLSSFLFSVGIYGVLARRNAVLVLMSIELMLNAANINFVVFNLLLRSISYIGQVFALFIITIAAAELGVGLAIVILIFRNRSTVSIDEVSLMKW